MDDKVFRIDRLTEVSNDELLALYGQYFQGRKGTKDDFTPYLQDIFVHCWCKETATEDAFASWDPANPGRTQFYATSLVLRDIFGGIPYKVTSANGGGPTIVVLQVLSLGIHALHLHGLPFESGDALRFLPLAPGDTSLDPDIVRKYKTLRKRLVAALDATRAIQRS